MNARWQVRVALARSSFPPREGVRFLAPFQKLYLLFLALLTHTQCMLTCMKERLPAMLKKKTQRRFHLLDDHSQGQILNFLIFRGPFKFFQGHFKGGKFGLSQH